MKYILNFLSLKQEISRLGVVFAFIFFALVAIICLIADSQPYSTITLVSFYSAGFIVLYTLLKRMFSVGFLFSIFAICIDVISAVFLQELSILVFALVLCLFPTRSVQKVKEKEFKDKVLELNEPYTEKYSMLKLLKTGLLSSKGRLSRIQFFIFNMIIGTLVVFIDLALFLEAYYSFDYALAFIMGLFVLTLFLSYKINIKRLHDLSFSNKKSNLIAGILVLLGVIAILGLTVFSYSTAVIYIALACIVILICLNLYLTFKRGDLTENEYGRTPFANTMIKKNERNLLLSFILMVIICAIPNTYITLQNQETARNIGNCVVSQLMANDIKGNNPEFDTIAEGYKGQCIKTYAEENNIDEQYISELLNRI